VRQCWELPTSQKGPAASVSTVEIEEEEGQSDSAKKRASGVEHDGMDKWNEPLWSAKGEPAEQLGLSKLALASMVAAGVQFGWALQLSLLTPYIQMLGIEHAFSSFIWLCGPITGLIVQPWIGIWSDQCTSKWGRRRPFIGVGVVMISVSVIIIGYSADIGYMLGDSHEDCQEFKGVRPRAAVVFIIGFWLLDFANNTVQGPARALLADLSGAEQRDAANAIFCLWMALGNILGFSTSSYGNLYRLFPGLTSRACCVACANLKAAFLLAILFLAVCATATMVAARETPLVVDIRKEQQLVDRKRSTGGGKPEGKKQQEDVAPELMTMVSVHDLHQEFGDGARDVAEENTSHRSYRRLSSPEDGNDKDVGAVVMKLLLGVQKLNGSMKIVLVVMALCWLSWFPFFLFDTDWMGREVYEGDPKGNSTQVAAYLRGVGEGSFGLLLNSVVLGITSLFIDTLCHRIGSKNLWALGNFIVFVAMACTGLITRTVATPDGPKQHQWSRVAAVVLFTVLGFPLAITYSVPYSLTAELTADSGGGQGLAMGILNLAVVIPQTIVALGAGPWDALFGGGNEPAFGLASLCALAGGTIALWKLPRLSRRGYQRGVIMHGPH